MKSLHNTNKSTLGENNNMASHINRPLNINYANANTSSSIDKNTPSSIAHKTGTIDHFHKANAPSQQSRQADKENYPSSTFRYQNVALSSNSPASIRPALPLFEPQTPAPTLAISPADLTITSPELRSLGGEEGKRASMEPKGKVAPSFRYSFRSSYRPFVFETRHEESRDEEVINAEVSSYEAMPRSRERGHLRSRSKSKTPLHKVIERLDKEGRTDEDEKEHRKASEDEQKSSALLYSYSQHFPSPPTMPLRTALSSTYLENQASIGYRTPNSAVSGSFRTIAMKNNDLSKAREEAKAKLVSASFSSSLAELESGTMGKLATTSFQQFVESSAYASCEAAVNNNIDLLRRSNALNEDVADYALLLEAENVEDLSRSPSQEHQMDEYIAAIEQAYEREQITAGSNTKLQGPDSASKRLNRTLYRNLPLPELPKMSFSDLSRRFSTHCVLERGQSNKDVIIKKLTQAGLQVAVDSLCIYGRTLLRISCSNDRLELEAEKIRLKIPVKGGGHRTFDRAIRHEFVGTGDSSTLFRSAERQLLIDHIIRSKVEDGGAGLDTKYSSMIADRFPLHMHARLAAMSPWLCFWRWHNTKEDNVHTERQLPKGKFRWIAWIKMPRLLSAFFSQPLHLVRSYFGEQIGFYFAFLEFYTLWLSAPTLLGIALFLSQLNGTSLNSPFVPFFALLMSLWASLFIESWKRRGATLATQWGVWRLEEDEEVTRPDYVGQLQRHEVTGRLHRMYPLSKRIRKVCISAIICFFLIASFSTLILNIFIEQDRYFGTSTSTSNTSDISAFFSLSELYVPVIYGFLIPLSEIVFNVVATKLTNWENWRTESLFHSTFTIKVFSFRFLNSFVPLYFYAFSGLGIVRLSQSVASFLIVGWAFRFVIYNIVPRIIRSLRRKAMRKEAKMAIEMMVPSEAIEQDTTKDTMGEKRRVRPLSLSTAWLESRDLEYNTFEDYCNLIIQFGYISFFSVAFPLAPLCAMLTNIVEVRAGAYKLLHVYRRPRALRSSGIGVWLNVLQIMSICAVLTNCALIGFTSTQIDNFFPSTSSTTKIIIMFIFEHIIIAFKFIIHQLNFQPRCVRTEQLRIKLEHDRLHSSVMEGKRQEDEKEALAKADREARRHEYAAVIQ